jgi:uncharacterized membrane protein YdjX (TVP38/TMEM64 family)
MSDKQVAKEPTSITYKKMFTLMKQDCSSRLFLSLLIFYTITALLNNGMYLYSSSVISKLEPYTAFVKEDPLHGWLISVVIYMVWVLLMLPSNVLHILLAYMLWKLYGTVFSIIASTILIYVLYLTTSLLSFCISRKCCKAKVQANYV